MLEIFDNLYPVITEFLILRFSVSYILEIAYILAPITNISIWLKMWRVKLNFNCELPHSTAQLT